MKAKGLAFLVITGKFKMLNSIVQNKITNNTMQFLDVFSDIYLALQNSQVSHITIPILD